ncbi:hypothetical protein [Kocuria arenosa]|uniref:hypothetical protein n=1 Tax=Kocuria arenosa TaxID=3071446 RepID=UPI0034D42F2A
MSSQDSLTVDEKAVAARKILENARRDLRQRYSVKPTVYSLTHLLVATLDCPSLHVGELMDGAGIGNPLRKALSARCINLFVQAYLAHPKPGPGPSPQERQVPRWPSEMQLAEVREMLEVQRSTARNGNAVQDAQHIAKRISNTMGWRPADTKALMTQSGLVNPMARSLTEDRIAAFMSAAAKFSVHYRTPPKSHTKSTSKGSTQKSAHQPAPKPPRPPAQQAPQRESAKQQAERLLKEREKQLRAKLKHTAPHPKARTRPSSPPATSPMPVTVPRGKEALPACRRLVQGNTSGVPARFTADLYLTIAELAAYGATADERAAAHIAAERYGIHTDAATAAQIHARAKRSFERETSGEALDHLSRLARRPRGLFYDAHQDRLILWETEDSTMTLYTCRVTDLRSCAATALELGDLGLPRLAKRVVNDRTLPLRADDPALVLAMAAEQLGRQSEIARRRAEALMPLAPQLPERAVTEGRLRDSSVDRAHSSVTWVVPVAGAHEHLEIGKMDASYTRLITGPRSRAATTVREHMRRPAGSSPYAQPTIKVRAHPRRGT